MTLEYNPSAADKPSDNDFTRNQYTGDYPPRITRVNDGIFIDGTNHSEPLNPDDPEGTIQRIMALLHELNCQEVPEALGQSRGFLQGRSTQIHDEIREQIATKLGVGE